MNPDLWNMTPEVLAHRAAIRRRNAQRKRKADWCHSRLYTLVWCLVIFTVVYLSLWAAYS